MRFLFVFRRQAHLKRNGFACNRPIRCSLVRAEQHRKGRRAGPIFDLNSQGVVQDAQRHWPTSPNSVNDGRDGSFGTGLAFSMNNVNFEFGRVNGDGEAVVASLPVTAAAASRPSSCQLTIITSPPGAAPVNHGQHRIVPDNNTTASGIAKCAVPYQRPAPSVASRWNTVFSPEACHGTVPALAADVHAIVVMHGPSVV